MFQASEISSNILYSLHVKFFTRNFLFRGSKPVTKKPNADFKLSFLGLLGQMLRTSFTQVLCFIISQWSDC